MVYTDRIHLVADSLEELHAFAESIGVKRCWFEGTRKGHPHYDLISDNLEKALKAGAVLVSSREVLLKAKALAKPRPRQSNLFN